MPHVLRNSPGLEGTLQSENTNVGSEGAEHLWYPFQYPLIRHYTVSESSGVECFFKTLIA